jgi:hypothetical protein
VVIVGHDIYEIEQPLDLSDLDVFDLLQARRGGDGELVMPAIDRALRIELPTQLAEQESEILLVCRPLDVPIQSSLDRELPVDVDAIEESRPLTNEEVKRGFSE